MSSPPIHTESHHSLAHTLTLNSHTHALTCTHTLNTHAHSQLTYTLMRTPSITHTLTHTPTHVHTHCP